MTKTESPVPDDPSALAFRGERILAFMVAGAIALSILAFLTVIIATAAGQQDFGAGAWPVVILLPAIGLPLGLVLMIALIVVSAVRRSRNAKDASN